MNKPMRTVLIGFFASCFMCLTVTDAAIVQVSELGEFTAALENPESGFGEGLADGSAGFQGRQEKNRKTGPSKGGSGGGGMGFGGPSGPGGQGSGKLGGTGRSGLGMGGPGGGAGGAEEDFGAQGRGGMPGGGAPGMSGAGGMGGMDMGMGMPAQRTVELVLKMYAVGDLIEQHADLPFGGFVLPGINNQNVFPTNRSSGGGFGGGGGGFGGGGGGLGGGASGGGLFAIPVPSRVQAGGGMGGGMGGRGGGRAFSTVGSVSTHDLANAIVESVSRESWSDAGGPGTISFLDEVMLVNQTNEVHQQIDLFLEMFREQHQRKPTVTLKAIWLTVDEGMFQSLDIERDQQVNSKVLAQLMKSHGQRAQVTCFDGQTVNIAAGNLRSTIESVVPVVGQIHPGSQPNRLMAQLELRSNRRSSSIPSHVMAQSIGGMKAAGGDGGRNRSGIGYQPISRWINYGAVLQLKPKVDADHKMLTVLVSSILIRADEDSMPAEKSTIGVDVDSHNLRCQQFQSNVRLKTSTPTLVGGSAFQSAITEGQTYLILEAIVNND